MKILHLATHTGVYRGGAVQLSRMAVAQRALGHDVRIVAQEDTRASKADKARNHESWAPVAATGVPLEFMDYYSVTGVGRLRSYLKRNVFDILHVHRDDALVAARLALIGLDSPALVAQRGTTSYPPWTARIAFCSAKTRAVVSVAAAVKESLIDANVDPAKIHVIYGSVDLEKFAPREPNAEVLASLDLPPGSRIIGSLSAYRGSKGFREMIKALARVLPEFENVYVVFLGDRVPKKVAPRAEKAGIADRCRFVGHQSNVADWISVMDLTLLTARSREGLSGVLRESLAMGVPVISTDCSGNREIVQPNRTGILVPTEDVDALAAAIRHALNNPAEMKRFAQAGRAWVVENCGTDHQAAQLIELYESILPSAPSSQPPA